MLRPSWRVRVRVKIVKCNFFFVCNGTAVPPAIYSEPRFHESFVMNSQRTILETSVGKTESFFNTPPVNKYRRIVRVVKYMYKKTYLSFRFITSRSLCQIKRGMLDSGCHKFKLKKPKYLSQPHPVFTNVKTDPL